MATVLKFPAAGGDRIPTPFNHREGDSYIRLSFEDADCPPLGFPFSVVFVARLGSLIDGAYHVLNTPEGAILANLAVEPDGKINVLSYHPDYPSRTCPIEALEVLGPVAEIWPRGFSGHRLVLDPIVPETLARPILSIST